MGIQKHPGHRDRGASLSLTLFTLRITAIIPQSMDFLAHGISHEVNRFRPKTLPDSRSFGHEPSQSSPAFPRPWHFTFDGSARCRTTCPLPAARGRDSQEKSFISGRRAADALGTVIDQRGSLGL